MNLPPLPGPGASRRDEDHFTEDQMRAYGESCARMAREEAAKVCDNEAYRLSGLKGTGYDTAATLARRIRNG